MPTELLTLDLSGPLGRNRRSTINPTKPLNVYVALTSWVESNAQHVIYQSDDGHINELAFQLGHGPWKHYDLTHQGLGGPPRSQQGALTSWASGIGTESFLQHVAYLDVDNGHVHELYFPHEHTWADNDLLDQPETQGAPPASLVYVALTSSVTQNPYVIGRNV